jgi:deoxyinosine 3'endonuclease (endonuclease V)
MTYEKNLKDLGCATYMGFLVALALLGAVKARLTGIEKHACRCSGSSLRLTSHQSRLDLPGALVVI